MAKKSKAVTALESFFHKTLKFGKRTTVVADVWGGSAAGFRIANIDKRRSMESVPFTDAIPAGHP